MCIWQEKVWRLLLRQESVYLCRTFSNSCRKNCGKREPVRLSPFIKKEGCAAVSEPLNLFFLVWQRKSFTMLFRQELLTRGFRRSKKKNCQAWNTV